MKIKSFFKNNYSYIVFTLITVFFVVFFQFLYLNNVDDRVYSTIAKSSFSDVLYFMEYHYNYCNGRTLMHLMLIFFLKFDVYLWRIVCPLSFCLLIVFSSMFISYDKKSFKKALFLFSVLSLFVSVNVYETTLFWATGSFNYVFPFMFLLITLLLIKYKKFSYFVPVLGFLCGATTEQCGMISVFCFMMYVFYDSVVMKNKLNKSVVCTIMTSVCGLLTVVLSPSVIARTYESNSNFFDKLNMIFFSLWFKNESMSIFIIMITTVVSIYLFSLSKNKFGKLLVSIYSLSMFLSYFLQYTEIPLISVLTQYAFPVALFIGIGIVCVSCIKNKNDYYPLFSMLLGMGAQFMMAVSQRFSFRTTLPSVFCFVFFAVALLKSNDLISFEVKKLKFVKGVLLVFLIVVITFNIFEYINLAKDQMELLSSGTYTTRHFSSPRTREDVDEIIDECEKVRFEHIDKHKT